MKPVFGTYIMEHFVSQGELFEILEDDKRLPEEQVQAIAKQLVTHFSHMALITISDFSIF